jgi:hypothetical protein
LNGCLAAWGTFVDIFAVGNGLRVWPATGMAALSALRLREQIVDLIDNWIALHSETNSRKAKYRSKHGSQY